MTMGDGPRSVRPSEDVIRRRLVERRLAHQSAEARKSWKVRLFGSNRRRNSSGATAITGAQRRPASLLGRLRHRPVAAFLVATGVGTAGIGLVLLGASGSWSNVADLSIAEVVGSDSTDSRPERSARSDEKTTTTDKPGARNAPRPESLRASTGDLPQSVATPPPSSEAIAAALALRLPEPKTGGESGSADRTDRELTTSSLIRAVGERAGAKTNAAQDDEAADPSGEPGSAEKIASLDGNAQSSNERENAASQDPSEADVPSQAGARIKTSVNMRSGPDNDANVLAILSRGTTVDVIGCDLWCHVTFEGKTGYVYKSFVDKDG